MKRDQTPLPAAELKTFLAAHPGWSTDAAGQLQRTFEFPAFLTGIAFVQKLALEAEKADHHPDLDIRYRKVTVRLFTHDAKALTFRDVELATAADALA
jgi:4a-hydroxytetrahydrobiopterin dehydratase